MICPDGILSFRDDMYLSYPYDTENTGENTIIVRRGAEVRVARLTYETIDFKKEE